MVQSNTTDIQALTEEQQLLKRLATGEDRAFWSLFQQHRDYLFRCCLKWMNGNSTEAEDLLSQAMLKALNKAHKYAEKIENFKSWITKLIRNYWLDLKRHRALNTVEHIEGYGVQEELGYVSVQNSPASALENDEQQQVIHCAIHQLPLRVRETFIMHFYQQLSHQEIAEQQEISYPNVCKRISQARAILREELRGYFIGEENPKIAGAVIPAVTESAKEEIFQKNVEEVDTPEAQKVTSSVGVAEAETVAGEEATSELVAIAATSNATLSIRKTAYSCVKAALSEWPFVSILTWAHFGKKTRIWSRFWKLVRGTKKLHQVRQLAEKYRRKTGFLPGSGFPSTQSLIKSLFQINIRGNFPVRLPFSEGVYFPNKVKPGTRLYPIGVRLEREQDTGFLARFIIGSKILPLFKNSRIPNKIPAIQSILAN